MKLKKVVENIKCKEAMFDLHTFISGSSWREDQKRLEEGLSVLSSNSDIKQKGEEAPSLDGSTSHQSPLG